MAERKIVINEQFDLYDSSGRPLGIRKARPLVHRDGDWHRSVALWIVRVDGRLLLQRRSQAKDTWPGRLTASVSGHYAAGESLHDVLREAREEIGLPVDEHDLISIGVWRLNQTAMPGILDRELQDVFLWPLDLALTAFRPDPTEVSGLYALAAADLLDLLDGKLPVIAADSVETGQHDVRSSRLTLADFVPTPVYHMRVARAALVFLAGESPSLGKQEDEAL